MRLSPADELFISSLMEGMRAAIGKRSQGDIDLEWELTNRLATTLAAQGHDFVAERLGLAKASRFDTPVTVLINGVAHATYEAGELRNDMWIAMVMGCQSVIDIPPLREEIMAREEIGVNALPDLIDDADEKDER